LKTSCRMPITGTAWDGKDPRRHGRPTQSDTCKWHSLRTPTTSPGRRGQDPRRYDGSTRKPTSSDTRSDTRLMPTLESLRKGFNNELKRKESEERKELQAWIERKRVINERREVLLEKAICLKASVIYETTNLHRFLDQALYEYDHPEDRDSCPDKMLGFGQFAHYRLGDKVFITKWKKNGVVKTKTVTDSDIIPYSEQNLKTQSRLYQLYKNNYSAMSRLSKNYPKPTSNDIAYEIRQLEKRQTQYNEGMEMFVETHAHEHSRRDVNCDEWYEDEWKEIHEVNESYNEKIDELNKQLQTQKDVENELQKKDPELVAIQEEITLLESLPYTPHTHVLIMSD
jgi:hypothetical protein